MRPGTYMVYQNQLNVFQAISMGGDLTNYANRKEVSIIRKTEKGTSVYKINLLSSQLLNSPVYYLQPGDIVYIEPLSGKNFTFTAFPYAIIFSTISTTLLILNFIK
jgi:polysaccharide export outer membrane protein